MLIDVEGLIVDCDLFRQGEEGPLDMRARDLDCRAKDCAKCMWNRIYAAKHVKEMELKDMTDEEIAALKKRNKLFPITANRLICYKAVHHEQSV